VDALEDAVFAGIARDRAAAGTRRARHRRSWIAAGAAAAVIVVAAVIAPGVSTLVGGAADESTAGSAIAPETAGDGALEGAPDSGYAGESSGGADQSVSGDTATAGRDIITTASATIVVEDPAVAARTIGDAATAHGGYVESMRVDTTQTGGQTGASDGAEYGVAPEDVEIYPYYPSGAWITVRVPTDELTAVIDDLGDVGEVTSSSISRQDVTDQTIDLRARIDAAQASVDRLTELMSQAGDLSDLIAAESALSERQATLEAYQQQLDALEGQVAMSSLTVSLTRAVAPVAADPAGFGDGLTAGWNGLVATLNGIVIALGFLLPWIAVIAILGGAAWGIVRLVRRRRSPAADHEG